jgi:hypothetical protein
MPDDVSGPLGPYDLRSLIRVPTPRAELPPVVEDPLTAAARLAARSVRRREDEEDEDEDENDDEPPRARKKRAKKDDDDDEDEDEKPAKKPAAKDKKADKSKKKRVVEEEEELPERRIPKKGSKRYSMYVVGNGLKTLRFTLIALFGVAGYASFHLTLFQLLKFDTGTISFVSSILMVVLIGCLPFAFLVGESMLFMTPARADARGPLIAAISLQSLSILLAIVALMATTLVTDAKLAERLQQGMIGGSNFAFWLSFLMLVTYFKQLFYYLGDKPSGNSASTLGLFFFLIIALGYAFFYVGWAVAPQVELLYFLLIPAWFLWDGAMGRCNVLILRNLKSLQDKVDNYIWPPDTD